MRNYFAIAFTCVYLTLAVGVAKTTHYCMGREKHSTLFSFTTTPCGCSLFMKERSSCCDDQQEIVKISDDHSSGQVLQSPDPQFNFLGVLFSAQLIVDPVSTVVQKLAKEDNLPPPRIPIYKANCCLVFYDSLV